MGGLFAESSIGEQAVLCVWQAGSLDRACIVEAKWWGFALGVFFCFFFLFKLPPCFSPMSILSEVYLCFQILAHLLSG